MLLGCETREFLTKKWKRWAAPRWQPRYGSLAERVRNQRVASSSYWICHYSGWTAWMKPYKDSKQGVFPLYDLVASKQLKGVLPYFMQRFSKQNWLKKTSDGTSPLLIAAMTGQLHLVPEKIFLELTKEELLDRNVHGNSIIECAARHQQLNQILKAKYWLRDPFGLESAWQILPKSLRAYYIEAYTNEADKLGLNTKKIWGQNRLLLSRGAGKAHFTARIIGQNYRPTITGEVVGLLNRALGRPTGKM